MTVNFDRIIEIIRLKDVGGELDNLFDDYIYAYREDVEMAVQHGSALLRLRRLARGQDGAVDETMEEASEKFARWIELAKR